MIERELCGHMMRTGEPCALRGGHAGQHRSAGSVERRREQRRASERDRRADEPQHGAPPQLELLHEERPDPRGASADDAEHRARKPGQKRASGIMGSWDRLRDRMRDHATADAAEEVTLAELLGSDEDERRANEGPWSSA